MSKPIDIPDGLILRRAREEDVAALAAFNAQLHRDAQDDPPNEAIAIWVRDLMRGDHPTFSRQDFTIVEEAATGKIVSSLNLIPQKWSYEDVEFDVGRPELVGTLPEYRNQGLVRAQFECIHAWGEQRNHVLQAITGIPNFYRQFGYDMALNLGGGREGYLTDAPVLEEGDQEPYIIRAATLDDLTFIQSLYRQVSTRSLVSCVRDEAIWRYELAGRSKESINTLLLRIIEKRDGQPVGFLGHPGRLWNAAMAATIYELTPGVSWLAVSPTVVRYLLATGKRHADVDKQGSLERFAFYLGTAHPVYDVLHTRLPRARKPYAWYLRLPDLPGFLNLISSVIERRLENSALAGHSGELRVSFYRSGLRFEFKRGRLKVAAWQPEHGDQGRAAFPGYTFLQLLFGYRSLEELGVAFADCRTQDDESRVLLEALFPKRNSNVWALV